MPTLITKNRKWIILGLLNLLSSLCLVSLALLSKLILDSAQNADTTSVLFYSSWLFGLIILGVLFKLVENLLYEHFYISREMELKKLLFEKRILLVFDNDKPHSAFLMQNYTTDIKNIVSGEMDVYPAIFYQIGRFFFALVFVVIIDWRILLILLIIGIIGLIFARIYSISMKKLHKEALNKEEILNAFFQETMENISLVEAYNAQASFIEHYNKKEEKSIIALKRKYHLQIMGNNIMVLASNILYGICIAYGGYAIAVSWITYGSLLALTQLISHLQTPILSISSLINQHSLASTSYKRLLDSISGKELNIEPINDFDSIEINKLEFQYNENNTIINNLSFEIKKGQVIRINGESGIGKTTLMMLLMGILSPNNGSIEVYKDNQIINGNRSYLFSYVSQENILFSSTIKENFELLATDSIEKMEEALKFACLDSEINSLDLVLNERGKGLSIGQIQRLAIAIAYAKDRPIFILDEFTSALDEENAQKIIQNLKETNKTIIYVSHKNETLIPDLVINLNNKS